MSSKGTRLLLAVISIICCREVMNSTLQRHVSWAEKADTHDREVQMVLTNLVH
jgi:hypothetical protein